MNDTHVLNNSSLDNYLFLRLFKIMTFICLVGTLLTWPILMPINATGETFEDTHPPIQSLNLTRWRNRHAVRQSLFLKHRVQHSH